MKLEIRHESPLEFMKSTSTIHDKEGSHTTVTFQPMERVYSEFRRVWNSPGYQQHLTAKDKQRGIV